MVVDFLPGGLLLVLLRLGFDVVRLVGLVWLGGVVVGLSGFSSCLWFTCFVWWVWYLVVVWLGFV